MKRLAWLLLLHPAVFGAYQYYFSSPLTTAPGTSWFWNGPAAPSSIGLTSSATTSLISTQTVPAPSTSYEVNMTLHLTNSGGTYTAYLLSSLNGMSGPAPQGTFYSLEIQNPNLSTQAATLVMNRVVNGSVTTLGTLPVHCANGTRLRAVVVNQGSSVLFSVHMDGVFLFDWVDSAILSGQPGVGVSSTPAGDSISEVDFGPHDGVAPSAVNTHDLGLSVFSNSVTLHWQPPLDDANGTGVWRYEIQRNGVYLGAIPETGFWRQQRRSRNQLYVSDLRSRLPPQQRVHVHRR
jgi:hypothetical protein